MRTRKRVLLAGSGLAVALAVGVPAVAFAADGGSGGSTPTTTTASSSPSATPSCPGKEVRQAVAQYLKEHPDVAAEWQKIRALPAGQRAAERKAYLAAHPDVKAALQQIRQQAQGSWADVLGAAGDFLAGHPQLADLLDQLRDAPAGQREQVAQTYLSQHPGVTVQLRQAVRDVRQHARACR